MPQSVHQALPPLCEQITDHLDAYFGYVGCRQENFDLQFGYFATIAEQQVDGIDCTQSNTVAELPYRSERVDATTYSVLKEELLRDQELFSAVHAISWAALGNSIDRWDGDEAARRRREQELRQRIRSVTALYQPLVSKVAEKLGSEDPCKLRTEPLEVHVASLPPILEQLTKVEDRSGCVKRGLWNFTAGQHIDPNIAVAIAWLQRGNMAHIPTLEQLEEKLRSMGVTLVEDTLAEH